MPQTLRLSGIRAEGKHGASAGERDAPQPFAVDLELEVEAGGDTIEETSDYREVAAAVRAVIEGESYRRRLKPSLKKGGKAGQKDPN